MSGEGVLYKDFALAHMANYVREADLIWAEVVGARDSFSNGATGPVTINVPADLVFFNDALAAHIVGHLDLIFACRPRSNGDADQIVRDIMNICAEPGHPDWVPLSRRYELVAEAIRETVLPGSPTIYQRAFLYAKPMDPPVIESGTPSAFARPFPVDAMRAYIATMDKAPAPQPIPASAPGVVDLRGILPFVSANLPWPVTALKTSTTVHWPGAEFDVKSDDDAANLLYAFAEEHIAKDWGTGSHGAGIMYQKAIAPSGTVFILREPDAVLWHSNSLEGNTSSRPILVICSDAHPPTGFQLRSLLDQIEGPAYPHSKWTSTQCPGDALRAWLGAPQEEEMSATEMKAIAVQAIAEAGLDPNTVEFIKKTLKDLSEAVAALEKPAPPLPRPVPLPAPGNLPRPDSIPAGARYIEKGTWGCFVVDEANNVQECFRFFTGNPTAYIKV